MGRSYCFECGRCGYQTTVSGQADRGFNFFVQTIVCRDCKQLYDAVTRIRLAREPGLSLSGAGQGWANRPNRVRNHKKPPSFASALNRLQRIEVANSRWVHFPLQCPVSPRHRIESWNDPSTCPRCGLYLEKNALPFRIWD